MSGQTFPEIASEPNIEFDLQNILLKIHQIRNMPLCDLTTCHYMESSKQSFQAMSDNYNA